MILKITSCLDELCTKYPDRSVGSAGNHHATRLFRKIASELGFHVEEQAFDCLDWQDGEVILQCEKNNFNAYASSYSNGCNIVTELVEADTIEKLELLNCEGKILFLHGELTISPIMPKNFVFYNPEEHQNLIALLESKEPAAIITASGSCPELTGAIYPFPVFEDGDFDIPSVFMTDTEGNKLLPYAGQNFILKSHACRKKTKAKHIVAGKGNPNAGKIVISAHIDTKKGTPGALDNAGGVIVLLILMELLKDYDGNFQLEFVPFNGEDYYGVPSQMLYLIDNQDALDKIAMNINLDAAGLIGERTGISYYDVRDELKRKAESIFSDETHYVEAEQWYQGDHMIFVMNDVPAIAISTENIMKVLSEVAHTKKDIPGLVDPAILLDIALKLKELITALTRSNDSN